jgi:hypothetical protein
MRRLFLTVSPLIINVIGMKFSNMGIRRFSSLYKLLACIAIFDS